MLLNLMFFCRTIMQYSKKPLLIISSFSCSKNTFLKDQDESAFYNRTRFKILTALSSVHFSCFWLRRNIANFSNILLLMACPKKDSIF